MYWHDRSARLDRGGRELVWRQIADDLRKDIDAGVLAVGEKLPSELDLGKVYGVARGTVHRALFTLRKEGRVSVALGEGTFVTKPWSAR
jgi:DNA-binding GntR family transcriptional regulator